jgi:hypothetical protein
MIDFNYTTETLYVEGENGTTVPKTIYEFSFPFEGKQEYLDWRQEWKTEYKALSKEIRELKRLRKPRNQVGTEYEQVPWKATGLLWANQDKARLMMRALGAARKRSRELAEQAKKAAA